ncbi:alpha- and gamma-adaptin-binding protein p34 [Lepeophtheirus salmonis]|uniref:alpha- and gamma-adaptin-binding protein p34 n=1 Tax=Lepeophtheirus salmonis TaxID=72036 RepID=UPI001AE8ADB1|nr:uncharacterized protein LOC121122377 [Lepeophtheirus salmonis]
MPSKEPNFVQIINHSQLKDLQSITSALLPQEELSNDGSLWRISNKYYSASVKLTLQPKEESSPNDPPAVLVYIDKSISNFDETQVLKDFPNAEVRLIVAQEPNSSCSSEFIAAIPCSGWELVDLSEKEEELGGSVGLPRVAEALQTVAWDPGEITKDTKSNKEESIREQEKEMESFEKLFNQFAALKSHSNSLSGDERKRYTEKVVTSFWRAMGGDEEEIAGLSSDEEN